MNREELESEGFDFSEAPDGFRASARLWVEDWGPFDTEAETVAAILRAVPALLS